VTPEDGDDTAAMGEPARWNRVPAIVKILTLLAWGGLAIMLVWWLAPGP
jgi:hypothetical protein